MNDDVYIFPHNANITLCFNIPNMELRVIQTEITDYCTRRPISAFAVYDVFQNGEERWLFPFMGNAIIRMNGRGGMLGVIRLFEELQQAKYSSVVDGIIYEDEDSCLKEYVNSIVNYQKCDWADIKESIG